MRRNGAMVAALGGADGADRSDTVGPDLAGRQFDAGHARPVLIEAMVDFCEKNDVSVAFASGDSSVVTLFDPTLRFVDSRGSLYSPLQEAGSSPAALVSSAVVTGDPEGVGLVPDGVTILGTFDPEVVFDGVYPAIVQNPAASGFRSGVFLFAGLAFEDEESVASLFAGNGMQIVRWEGEQEPTLMRLFSSLFGKVMLGFVLLSFLTVFLVLRGYAVLSRARLEVAARCGATAADLRRLILARLVPQSLVGLLGGTALVVGLAGALRETMLAGAWPVLAAIADEPTAALDAETAAAITEQLRALAEGGAALLIATHDDAVARACDSVYRFEGAKVREHLGPRAIAQPSV